MTNRLLGYAILGGLAILAAADAGTGAARAQDARAAADAAETTGSLGAPQASPGLGSPSLGAAAARGAASPKAALQRGVASWYGPGFHGRRTASGERFDTNSLTAAHRTLPFGTRVRVVHERTGRSVVVRINDRGPFTRGRVIDLARGSAQALGLSGVAPVSLHPM